MESDIVIVSDNDFMVIVYTNNLKILHRNKSEEGWCENRIFSSIINEDEKDIPFYLRLESSESVARYEIETSICSSCYDDSIELLNKDSKYDTVLHMQDRKIRGTKITWVKIETIFNNKRINLIESNHELLELEARHVDPQRTLIN